VVASRPTGGRPPTIVVTVRDANRAANPDEARAKNERYLDRLRAAGANPVALDETADSDARAERFGAMDGLLLSGGHDLDPSLYGQAVAGAEHIEPGRDALEQEAWRRARQQHVPVLGICRGLQAINVFSGGTLVQHVEGHTGSGPRAAHTHPLRVTAGSRLARILRPTGGAGGIVLHVNSSHHQAVRRENLAPGYLVAGTSPAPGGELVEAFESADRDAFVLAVQFHPERVETTPPEFERLWTVFVDACRGSAVGTRVG